MSDTHGHPHAWRRQFLKRSFTFFGAFAPVSRFVKGAQKPEPAHPAAPSPVRASTAEPHSRNEARYAAFDAHLHCPSASGQVWQWHPVTRTFEEFVSYLDRTGVQRGIINSVRCQEAKTPAEFIAGNREVARYVEKYKGRFLGAAVVNPLFIDEALREIEDCHKQLGFVWVGELCNYMAPFAYTIKEFELLVAETVKMNMVLDVHTELEEMEYIIRQFPQATIVFPHFGDGHEYDHIFKRIDLVAQHPNCYLDTSGYGHDRMGMLEYAVGKIGADRVLFGSDFSINDPSTVIARIRNSFLTEEQKRKVLSENLQRLLKTVSA
ncbi:MAG: amidohydrolase family protein [Acidobacteriia bacterium]|nr:amidohydrolase family protein [Terriglobia bacterium]